METAPSAIHICAEIGTSHGGSIEKAKELIRAAADAGADSVKFQWVYADEILHPATGLVTLPGGNISLYNRFKELEVDSDFFDVCGSSNDIYIGCLFDETSAEIFCQIS